MAPATNQLAIGIATTNSIVACSGASADMLWRYTAPDLNQLGFSPCFEGTAFFHV